MFECFYVMYFYVLWLFNCLKMHFVLEIRKWPFNCLSKIFSFKLNLVQTRTVFNFIEYLA